LCFHPIKNNCKFLKVLIKTMTYNIIYKYTYLNITTPPPGCTSYDKKLPLPKLKTAASALS
jgi:hypothetical protein